MYRKAAVFPDLRQGAWLPGGDDYPEMKKIPRPSEFHAARPGYSIEALHLRRFEPIRITPPIPFLFLPVAPKHTIQQVMVDKVEHVHRPPRPKGGAA